MINFIRKLMKNYSMGTGRARSAYVRFCRPNSQEWGEYLAKWGGFYAIGTDVSINIGCNVTDPYSVNIGSNVSLSACTLLGHDAIVRIFNNKFGKKLDSVGFIHIKDNSFVGHGAIVMPRVTIGPDSVVAAGAVVTKDVPPGMVVGGNPAKVICSTEQLLQRIEERSNSYPWIDLIRSREGSFDPLMEPQLKRMRVEYFYGDETRPDHVAVPAHD